MKTQNNSAFVTVFSSAILLVVLDIAALAQAQPTALELGKPIERQIKGGETHSFQFPVKAGHYARVEVEQKNIDVIVSLFAPDGKLVVEMDGKDDRLWRAQISCIAEKSGLYRLGIKAYGFPDQLGRFEIVFSEMRHSNRTDNKRVRAERRLATGRKYFELRWQRQPGTPRDYSLVNRSFIAKAAEEFRSSAQEFGEINESGMEAIALLNHGTTLIEGFVEVDGALLSLSRAVELFEKTGDQIGYSKAKYHLSRFSPWTKQQRLELYQNLADIRRELGDARGLAVFLGIVASQFRILKQNQKARESLEEGLAIARRLRIRNLIRHLAASLGALHLEEGNFAVSLELYHEALVNNRDSVSKEDPFKVGFEVTYLIEIGKSYEGLGQSERAEESIKLALNLGSRESFNESTVLEGLGDFFRGRNPVKAINYYNRHLDLVRKGKFNESVREVFTLIKLGGVYQTLRQFDNAINIQRSILSVSGDLELRGLAYWNLCTLFDLQKQPDVAIVYGKLAINVNQTLLGRLERDEARKEFLKGREFQYRSLADILIASSRIPEAQAVLDLLKTQEYEQIKRSDEAKNTVPYTGTEAEIIAKIERLVALEKERSEILNRQKEGLALSREQKLKLEQLRLDIVIVNKAFDVSVTALSKQNESVAGRVDDIKGSQEIQSALIDLGRDTGSGVVALYTVLGTEDEKDEGQKSPKSKFGWVIMVTERGYKAYPINVTNLEQNVFQFRNALSSDTYNPQPLAEKIYDAIFRQVSPKFKRTLEDDLRDYLGSHKDKTLMWSLDGVLRYVPMPALHDGKHFLIESYRSVVFTKQSFLWLTRKGSDFSQALGLGVSESRETFPALPGARIELETIVREPNSKTGILNGTIKLNENFRKQFFFSSISDGSFPIVHIASHYSFNPAQQDASFLLLGDGRLTFGELKENKNLFGTVDLLTLSACDTGLSSNGKEAEGFAYLAQSLGAKSVIASLWKVSDTGTPEMMIGFYKLRAENPNMPKGEAFRRAQLSLLYGGLNGNSQTTSGPRSEIVNIKGKQDVLPQFVKDEKRPFAHPHYWSSFVLIGNWR